MEYKMGSCIGIPHGKVNREEVENCGVVRDWLQHCIHVCGTEQGIAWEKKHSRFYWSSAESLLRRKRGEGRCIQVLEEGRCQQ